MTTTTFSREQFAFVQALRETLGPAGARIDVQLTDYRELTGRFDKIVSIEMLEAVGHSYLPEYCAVLDRVLRPDGLVALQFITCPDDR